MSDIAVGIIGYGRIGAEHAAWLSKASAVRIAAADDVTPARRQLAAERGLRVYDNLAELLADNSIDAVLVSTPTAMHFEHASAALAAGKHVMVEKPLALDLHQSKTLL